VKFALKRKDVKSLESKLLKRLVFDAALALDLSDEGKVPVVILNEERHFEELEEVVSVRISNLKL